MGALLDYWLGGVLRPVAPARTRRTLDYWMGGGAGGAAVADEGGAEAFADATLRSWWHNIGHKSGTNIGHKKSNPRVSFHGKKRRQPHTI